ncbi:serine protease inhibitor Kazal-type 2 isoform X1 [Vulpes vulpes]|uniref:Serine protease inhibitor Kazal-type 2 isoform X1 n=2 Tax=Caniformia TaxID=379584 RepID=A0ABM4ZR43_VULVU
MAGRGGSLALRAVSLVLLLLARDVAASLDSLSSAFGQPSEYRTLARYLGDLRDIKDLLLKKQNTTKPNCNQYKLPGCPRDFSPVCGSDMSTYPNECTLCMKIREDGRDVKIIRSGPC